MQCPFCHQAMRAIDSGKPPPHLAVIWVCKQCVNEVRVMAEKDVETEQFWITKRVSIFVPHNNKEYCLHWNYVAKYFEIMDTGSASGYIFHTSIMPSSITPDNALNKLQIFLTFL